jgi:hypothetical protein
METTDYFIYSPIAIAFGLLVVLVIKLYMNRNHDR